MTKGIVITTHDSTFPFFVDLMESLKGCKYPVAVKKNTELDNGWELAGVRLGIKLFDEFLYLHDTVFIKNPEFIEQIFHPKYNDISVSVFPEFNAYMGKYISRLITPDMVPEISTKREAVNHERIFTRAYMRKCGLIYTLFPEIDAWKVSKTFEMKHGRNNCIYENDYIKKYKGTWREDMIP